MNIAKSIAIARLMTCIGIAQGLAQGPDSNQAATNAPSIPKHLQNRPSELYAREAGKIVNAPTQDVAVARAYPEWQDKGEVKNGQRITIMNAKREYRMGEQVRVIHVLESPQPGNELYVMGPKPIQEEYVDGKLASSARADLCYDGAVVQSPGVDFNYEVSLYAFDKPGEHTIQWKGGGHPIQGDLKPTSNVLRIKVMVQKTTEPPAAASAGFGP